MSRNFSFRAWFYLFCSFCLSACGTLTPQIEEIWDDKSGPTLELKIKKQIYCEVQSAVAYVNQHTSPIGVWVSDPHDPTKEIEVSKPPLPEDWGVQIQLQLTVDENTNLAPGVTFNTPMIPGTTFFPGKVTVPGPQSYSFGLGGTLIAEAIRIDKFSSYYLISDLDKESRPECYPRSPTNPYGRPLDEFQGSSLLLESDLGIEKWLDNAVNMRAFGVSRKSAAQEVLSYDVKFEILSSGNVTPTWKLVRVTTSSGNLFSTKRDRTHEMILTLGPSASPPTPAKPKGAAKVLQVKAAEPGTLARDSALASDIGASVANQVRLLTSPLLSP